MQEIYSPKWLILCVTMHVVNNIAFTARDVDFKIFTFLKDNQVISKSFQVLK